MRKQEFAADFVLVARRALTESEGLIFRFHFLLGADWRQCCARLGMDRGSFFHEIYRIEAKLGRVFRELEPFALYPLDEYFGGTVKKGSGEFGRARDRLARLKPVALVPPLLPKAA